MGTSSRRTDNRPLCGRPLDAMVPIKFLGLERGLTIHFEGQHLVELALRSQRQGHGLAQHVGARRGGAPSPCRPERGNSARPVAPRPKRPSGVSLPFRRRPTATASTPLASGADRGDHYRVGGAERRPAQPLRQQIRELPEPPSEELAHHDPRPSRANPPIPAAIVKRSASDLPEGSSTDQADWPNMARPRQICSPIPGVPRQARRGHGRRRPPKPAASSCESPSIFKPEGPRSSQGNDAGRPWQRQTAGE